MNYEVTHEGAVETHVIKLHKVDMAEAAKFINPKLYKKLSSTDSISDAIAALALICKGIEVSKQTVVVHDAKSTDEASGRNGESSPS